MGSTRKPGQPPPTGKKFELPWILGDTGGGVLLSELVVVLVLVSTGSGPRAAAEEFAQAVEDQDISTIRGMPCSEHMDAYSQALQGYAPRGAAPLDITTEINEVSVDASTTFDNVPDELKRFPPSDPRTQEHTFTKKDGEWEFCATP
ncbi:hypothetical protein [Actinopolyspora halophila]|uniref:hypothetical protein n=1 Tax=Actinopolyspora halophila TaxID=1850 RepID=UPI000364EBB5|nr:hypothetical protein [Actinopolyspora halophila]